MQSGSWEFNTLFRDALVAQDWGKDPDEFYGLPKSTQAMMIAVTEAKTKMELYENQKRG